MKLVEIENCHDNEYSKALKLTFEHEGERLDKTVVVTSVWKFKKENERDEMTRLIQKAAREADRDFAFKKHGANFREHCEIKSNFWHPMLDVELDKVFG